MTHVTFTPHWSRWRPGLAAAAGSPHPPQQPNPCPDRPAPPEEPDDDDPPDDEGDADLREPGKD